MADFEMYGPRETYTRPSNLAQARNLVQQEQLMRTNTGPTFWGRTWRSGEDINRISANYPAGFAQAHGGRGVAETRRDQFLNSLRKRRGMQPMAPQTHPSFIGGQLRAGFGNMNRSIQSFVNRRF